MRRAALMTFALAAGLGVAVRPAWSSSIAGGGRIEKLVAGSDRIYAWGAGGVEVFDGEGRPLERCARFEARPARAGRRPIGAPDPDDVLTAAGFTDDDDSSDAEDALEEDGTGAYPRRRALAGEVVEVRDPAAATPAARPRACAAGTSRSSPRPGPWWRRRARICSGCSTAPTPASSWAWIAGRGRSPSAMGRASWWETTTGWSPSTPAAARRGSWTNRSAR